jgi:hypothetical protein
LCCSNGSEYSKRGRSCPQSRATVTLVGIGGSIEDFCCHGVHAPSVTRSTSGQPAVDFVRNPEQQLLHVPMISSALSDIMVATEKFDSCQLSRGWDRLTGLNIGGICKWSCVVAIRTRLNCATSLANWWTTCVTPG